MQRRLGLVIASFLFFTAWTFYEFPSFSENMQHAVAAAFPTDGGSTESRGLWSGDHFQAYYLGWKLRQTVLGGYNIMSDPFTFASNIGSNYDFHIGIQFIAFAVMGALCGDGLGYFLSNTVLALALAFLFGVYMAQALTRSRIVAVLAGLAVSMVPYHIVQMMGGHTGGFVYMLNPLYLGAILTARYRPEKLSATALAGLTLVLAITSDEHQAYYLLLLSAVVFPVWGLQTVLGRPWRQALMTAGDFFWQWRYLILGLLVALAYGEALNRFVLGGADGDAHTRRSITEVEQFSKPLTSFFLASTSDNIGHLLARALGLTSLLWLALGGVRGPQGRAFLKSPGLACLLAFILCLFTMVGMGSHWSQQVGVYRFLFKHMPYFDLQRVPHKMFGLVACLLIALSCMVFEALRRQTRGNLGWQRRVRQGLAGLMVLGLAGQATQYFWFFSKHRGQLQLVDLQQGPQAIYRYLKTQGSVSDLVLTLPVGNGDARHDTRNFAHAISSGVRMATGYNGAPPSYYRRVLWSLQEGLHDGAFTRKAANYLLNSGVSYFLLDDQQAVEQGLTHIKAHLDQTAYLQQVLCDASYCLYSLDRDRLAQEATLPDRGLSAYETWREDRGRWMRSGADVPPWLPPEAVEGMPVFSVLNVPTPDTAAGVMRCVALDFKHYAKQFPVWIIDEGGQAEVFNPPWTDHGHGTRIITPVKGSEFVVGLKDYWRPSEWSAKIYPAIGHYIWGVSVLPLEACPARATWAKSGRPFTKTQKIGELL